MGKINQTISTLNSAVRTLVALVITGLLVTVGYMVYEQFGAEQRALQATRDELETIQSELVLSRRQVQDQQAEIDRLGRDVAEKQREIERLDTALQLLKVDQRLARLEVVDQQTDDETGQVQTTVRFIELTPDGDTIGEPREFTVDGDVVYIDNWVVKFEDEFVEQADLARGTSLALFRRIFGEDQSPNEGFQLDPVGRQPQAYVRGGEPSEFEQQIWSQFWQFANDREKAREQGIRAAHGEAISIKTEKGKAYRIVLRASDGLSIVPDGPVPPEDDREAAR